MDVSASDVEQVRFPTARKGYDPGVVDQFLDRVAATLRHMDERLRELAARNQSLEAQLNEQREAEAIMRRTLQVAQRTADETVAEAQARAREMVSEAQSRAAELERRAQERAREIEAQLQKQIRLAEAEVEALRQHFHQFRESATRLVNEFLGVLQRAESLSEQQPPRATDADRPLELEEQRDAGVAPSSIQAPSPARETAVPVMPQQREGAAVSHEASPGEAASPEEVVTAERPRSQQPPPPPQPRVAPPRQPGQTQVIEDFAVRDAEPPRPATAPPIPQE